MTRWIQCVVVLYVSSMSSQPLPPPPAPTLHGHPHSLVPRALGGTRFGTTKGERGWPGGGHLVTHLLQVSARPGAGIICSS